MFVTSSSLCQLKSAVTSQAELYYTLDTHTLDTHTLDTHTHPFNGPLSGTTQVSHYQKGKTNLDFNEARDIGWQWHQLGYMQVCTSLQTDNHTSTPPLLCFFTGRMPFLYYTRDTIDIKHRKTFFKEC